MLANKLLHKFTLVPYDEDMYDEFAAGSLILINWRTADALVEATTQALRDGSLKRVGILFTLDTQALASRENLLKVNLSLRSMWGGGLILIKPKTSRCKKERQDSGIVPYRDIPEIAVEINKAFDKLQMLLINNRRPASQPSSSTSSGSSTTPSPGPQREAMEVKAEEDTAVAATAANEDVEEAASAD